MSANIKKYSSNTFITDLSYVISKPIEKLMIKFLLLVVVSINIISCVTDSSSLTRSTDRELKAKAHSELASSYIQLGKYEIAQKELEKAFAADSKYLGSYYVAGVLSLKMGLPKEAEKNFRIATKDKKNSTAAHELGVLLCRTERAQESIPYFIQAIENPLFTNRAMSNLRAGECVSKYDINKAQNYFTAALTENPNMVVALYRLAEVFYLENKLLRARAYLERYKSTTEVSPQTLYLGYQIENKAQSVKAANEYSKQLLKEFPGSQEAKKIRKSM